MSSHLNKTILCICVWNLIYIEGFICNTPNIQVLIYNVSPFLKTKLQTILYKLSYNTFKYN